METWLTSTEFMETLGFFGTTKCGKTSVSSVLNSYKERYPLPEDMIKKVGQMWLYSSNLLENEAVCNYLKDRASKLKYRRHDVVCSEDEKLLEQACAVPVPVELTDKRVEDYESAGDKADKEYAEFCMSTMDDFLTDWELQCDRIVKIISHVLNGDSSAVPALLHKLHDDVEAKAHISFDKLKIGKEDSTIKCIRRDKRLQYYFLRCCRNLALEHGVVYLENV